MARAKQFRADQIVVCFEAFGTGAFPGQPVISPGTRYRGDNPIVKNSPQYFAPDGTDADELTRLRVKLIQEAEKNMPLFSTANPEQPTEIVRPVSDRDAVVAIAGAAAGERVHWNSPAVTADPTRYVKVNPDSLERADALVALETLVIHGDDAKAARTLYKGQWTRRDDPLVQLHPTMFTLPPYIEQED